MNYPKIIVVLLLCSTFTACGLLFGRFNSYKDEFKNSNTHTLEQTIIPTERPPAVNNAIITYERVVKENAETVKVYFVINRTMDNFQADNKVFMKAYGEKYEITPERTDTDLKIRQEVETTATTVKDSTKTNTLYKTDIRNYDEHVDKFVICLTSEMIHSILLTDELIFRFYYGPSTVTFKLKGTHLSQVRKLLIK